MQNSLLQTVIAIHPNVVPVSITVGPDSKARMVLSSSIFCPNPECIFLPSPHWPSSSPDPRYHRRTARRRQARSSDTAPCRRSLPFPRFPARRGRGGPPALLLRHVQVLAPPLHFPTGTRNRVPPCSCSPREPQEAVDLWESCPELFAGAGVDLPTGWSSPSNNRNHITIPTAVAGSCRAHFAFSSASGRPAPQVPRVPSQIRLSLAKSSLQWRVT
jgi:hypothetical protein